MSEDDDNHDANDMGPPRDEHGRWKKGGSGNPRGRPIKAERSQIPLQLRRDIIKAGEKLRRVKVDGRQVKVPTVAAILENATYKALTGNGPAQRHFIELFLAALRDNETDNRETAEALKAMEKDLKRVGKTWPELDKKNIQTINRRRKDTRDTGEPE